MIRKNKNILDREKRLDMHKDFYVHIHTNKAPWATCIQKELAVSRLSQHDPPVIMMGFGDGVWLGYGIW